MVGDSAGLKIPATGEGIGTALSSGLLAADSIIECTKTGQVASTVYLSKLAPMLADLRSHYAMVEDIKAQACKGPQSFLDAVAKASDPLLP